MNESDENKSLKSIFSGLMLQTVPSYANKIFYSLGFLSMTSLVMLILSGTVMVFFGADWWLTNSLGIYVRSVHLWATQAFIFFIFLHLLIVFLTSGFKGKRKLTWAIGVIMLLFVFAEAEFGYILRGDFSSQWRSLQATDLYNGAGLGHIINNLNTAQIFGIHTAFLPLLLIGLLSLHYLFIKIRGIAKPYRADVQASMVKANHTVLFLRGITLAVVILVLAFFFHSPFIAPYTIKDVAKSDPTLVASTLVKEFDRSSGTATYLDNINPYTFDSREIFISIPYKSYLEVNKGFDYFKEFNAADRSIQDQKLKDATDYFNKKGDLNVNDPSNPVVSIVSALVVTSQSGLYEDSLKGQSVPKGTTYATRFLSDTGVLEAKAEKLKITTPDYGMVKEESGIIPPGAWWLTPIGILNHTVLANDENGDRDGAIILGLTLFLLLAFPYIPVLNRLPEKLPFARWIWKEKTDN